MLVSTAKMRTLGWIVGNMRKGWIENTPLEARGVYLSKRNEEFEVCTTEDKGKKSVKRILGCKKRTITKPVMATNGFYWASKSLPGCKRVYPDIQFRLLRDVLSFS